MSDILTNLYVNYQVTKFYSIEDLEKLIKIELVEKKIELKS